MLVEFLIGSNEDSMRPRLAILTFVLLVCSLVFIVASTPVGPEPSPKLSSALASCNLDNSGRCTVNHNLGVVPESVLLTPSIVSGLNSYTLSTVKDSFTATSFVVRAMVSQSQPKTNVTIWFSYVVFGTGSLSPSTTTTTVQPPIQGFPNNSNTGVPVGTIFDTTINGDYTVTQDSLIIDKWHITGNLIIAASNIEIKNSQIDGFMGNAYSGANSDKHFTLTDTTVGPSSGCILDMSAVTESNYIATRVHLRNVSDGFGITQYGNDNPKHSDVTIADSFVELCGVQPVHSDGIQGYIGGTNVVISHNTINQLPCSKASSFPSSWKCTQDDVQTAPIFISDGSTSADVHDNLLIGGSSSIRINYANGGIYNGANNFVVNNSWQFGPVDNENGMCDGHINPWTRTNANGNKAVIVDENFQLVSIVSDLFCAP